MFLPLPLFAILASGTVFVVFELNGRNICLMIHSGDVEQTTLERLKILMNVFAFNLNLSRRDGALRKSHHQTCQTLVALSCHWLGFSQSNLWALTFS